MSPAASSARTPALLVLEDGFALVGRSYGATGRTVAEVVFNTAMTGYQETLTDPSYHRQIVVMTAPHIGNTGVNDEDPESGRIWVAGYVVRDPARRASSWRARRELEDELREAGVVGICDVDTRALTRHLRERGAMRAGIFSGEALPAGVGPDPRSTPSRAALDICLDAVRSEPVMEGQALAAEVSTDEGYVVEPSGVWQGREPVAVVAAVDLGIKARTPFQLAERGVRVHVLPQSTTLPEVLALRPDGVFFSNGPGDPGTADAEVALLRGVLDAHLPFFGICLGNQIFGRALGYGTYKLGYGHRGVNQPVLDRATGRVEITAHNHGFAVDAPVGGPSTAPYDSGRYGRVEVSHVGLNDGVVEGLRALDLPAFSVQYHPEAAAGPHDGEHLFDRFVRLMTEHRAATGHSPETTAEETA
ncbi:MULTISPECIES: glutamine-hydrolyzing carbamoyl-phosphate synthase small subunit [unclassified Actinomyces]|uniref:glutamine-hydrolyzing carbamoyl-phosphate synthase small subunit n=1 Tax=unclassified Actinomyces TaxID=2609248 RepID=UPI002016D245|nr:MULTISPECIES: glutamine-hydrolyzing carbamoyl-phosphate synthase small subunit [unclassified Actinomyces]MCL3778713.1 glutamine-hydrolyzing carbamoyl-phosphate synthase small subunit [Actinomyces sp. AC-20-1]MCL3789204.1 glutamine-hydrolyzing carbamoyl-phosphate synthase small subunit [Actinomyces sp. 187325]MCL3791391.1 glutamine-hydrolyzing carbamoyl-phosphate synthase small subunit [Actinomyces sp. 186855]MCL3793584.1 glutamine-hydrolyzing carbamoyl-phosphate synthase small subunit [Actin